MKVIPIPGQMRRAPKHIRLLLAGFAVAILGVFLYYLATASPMFGRAAPPDVTTNAPSNVTANSATLEADLTSTAGQDVTARGIQYGTSTSYGSVFNDTAPSGLAYQSKWGSLGTGNGQFNNPRGLQVDNAGNLYVSDSSNNRIQKFASNGTYTSQFGVSGSGDGEFNGPYGIAFDSSGNIYVSDPNNDRIQKFNSSGTYLTQWGEYGTGNGQFNNNFNIAIDANGYVYVADYNNNRIQKFDANGTYIMQWGSLGTGNGQFDRPAGIAIDSAGSIYVADAFNHRIQKFTTTGVYVTKWGSSGTANGQFTYPWGITASQDGSIFVVESGGNRIQQFSNTGTFISKIGSSGSGDGQLNSARGIAVNADGLLYVADSVNNRVQVFSSRLGFTTGVFTHNLTSLTCGTTYHYRAFATNADGTTYGNDQSFTTSGCSGAVPTVTTGTATSVSAFDATLNGTIVNDGGTPPLYYRGFQYGLTTAYGTDTDAGTPTVGAFSKPLTNSFACETTYHYRAYATNDVGTGYGADQTFTTSSCSSVPTVSTEGYAAVGPTTASLNGSVGPAIVAPTALGFEYGTTTGYGQNISSSYNQEFAYEGKWGSQGSGDGQFNQAEYVAYDSIGNVYVVDKGNNRIQKFTSDGTFVTKWGSSGTGNSQFDAPTGIAIDNNDAVYITDWGNNRIQKFTSDGTFVTKWGTYGAGNGQLSAPRGIAVDGSDSVFVADYGNRRVQKFNPDGTYVSQWNAADHDNPSDGEPYGMAIDTWGSFYITYAENFIQKFDSNGNFIAKWGSAGSGNGQFDFPTGIAVDGGAGRIYVADLGNGRVQILNPNGTYYGQLVGPGSGPGQAQQPWGVAIDDSIPGTNKVFITDYDNSKANVLVYSSIQQVGLFQENVSGLTCNTLYHYRAFAINSVGTGYGEDDSFTTAECSSDVVPTVTTQAPAAAGQDGATLNGTVVTGGETIRQQGFQYGLPGHLDASTEQLVSQTGAYAGSWGTSGTANGDFSMPSAAVVGSTGSVYVADAGNSRIQKFDSNGNFIAKWGSAGTGDGQFGGVTAMAIDNANNVYVLDAGNSRIQKFDSTGNFIAKWDIDGTDDDQSTPLARMAIDAVSGVIYVGDLAGPSGGPYEVRVEKYTAAGAFVSSWDTTGLGQGELTGIAGIAIDSSHNVFIADSGDQLVKKYTSDGAYISRFGGYSGAHGKFSALAGITIDSDDFIYTVDNGTYRGVQKFTNNGSYIIEWGTSGSGPQQFLHPLGTAISADKTVYVVDMGNNRIVKYTQADYNTSFSDNVAGLECGTTYSYRAYATNDIGTGYGDEVSFDTVDCSSPPSADSPTVRTDPATSITGSQAYLNGTVLSGMDIISLRRFVYGTTTSYGQSLPGIGSSVVPSYAGGWGSAGTGNGQFGQAFVSATDSTGNVYVSDIQRAVIQKFDSGGNYLSQIALPGGTSEGFGAGLYIVVDSQNNLFVGQPDLHRVLKFNASGGYVSSFGSVGPGNGQFDLLGSLAVDSAGNIYVADLGSARIQKFNNNGSYLSKWGSPGTGNGQFQFIRGLDIDSEGNIYVSDGNLTGNDARIQKFDSSASWVASFGSTGTNNGEFRGISSIWIDANDRLYVMDSLNQRVQKWSTSGTYLSEWSISGQGNNPPNISYGITGDGLGHLYTVDTTNSWIQRFDISNTDPHFTQPVTGLTCGTTYHYKALADSLFPTASGEDQTFTTSDCGLADPPTVTTLPASDVLTTSSRLNGRIDSALDTVATHGFEYGTDTNYGTTVQEGSPSYAYAGGWSTGFGSRFTAIDSQGNYYAADFFTYAISKYDPQGNVIASWGSYGTGQGQFRNPTGIAVDPDDNVYVADTELGSIQKFDSDGNFIMSWGDEQTGTVSDMSGPSGIAIGTNGLIYVVNGAVNGNLEGRKVKAYDYTTGAYVRGWGGLAGGSGDGQFEEPYGIALDSANNVYVTESEPNARVQKFDSQGNFITKWGSIGSAPDQFGGNQSSGGPRGIAVSPEGDVYVVDPANNLVKRFTSSGTYVNQFGYMQQHGGDGGFTAPNGITTNQNTGRISIVDIYNGILNYDPITPADTFNSVISGLSCDTTYYYRAFATNAAGTGYGDSVSFTTNASCGGGGDDEPQTDFSLTKTLDNTGVVKAGDTVTYRMKITNEGDTTAPFYGAIYDVLPQEVTFQQEIQTGHDNIVCYDQGVFDPDGLPTFMQPYAAHHLGYCVLDLVAAESDDHIGTEELSPGESVEFEIGGIANADFIPNATKNRAIYLNQNNENSFSQIFNDFVSNYDGSSDVFALPYNNVAVHTYSPGSPPTITTNAASGTTRTTSTLSGTVNSGLSTVTSRGFRYGTTTNYGTTTTEQVDARGFAYAGKWGSPGTGNGQFSDTTGITTDSVGNVYVAEAGNSRVQKFDSNGNFLLTWGGQGSGNGKFTKDIMGIKVGPDGYVYVTDPDGARIQKFDTNGNFISQIGNTGPTEQRLCYPISIAFDQAGALYATDVCTENQDFSRVVKFDVNGNFLLTWGESGNGVGQFGTAIAIAVDPQNNVLVFDVANGVPARIQKFDSQGNFITKFADGSNGSVALTVAYSLEVDAQGNIYAANFLEHKVQKLDSTGHLLGEFGAEGSGDGQFITAVYLTINGQNLYVTDVGLSRIQKFGILPVVESTFTKAVNDLVCGTTYHYQAYATNPNGTGVGADRTLTTNACGATQVSPPRVVITAPTNKQVFGARTTSVNLSADAFSDTSNIDKVEFYVDGLYVGTVSQPPYSMTALGLPAGKHTLVAKAYDALGASVESTPVEFFVSPVVVIPGGQNTNPTPSTSVNESAPALSGGGSPTLQSVASDNFAVQKRGWLDLLLGHNMFKSIPFLLILLLLIMVILYARQAAKEYLLRSKILRTLERYRNTLTATNDFLAITSHYLNTPVAILGGAIDLADSLKTIPEASTTHLRATLKTFSDHVERILASNQVSATQTTTTEVALNPELPSPLKDRAIWLPVTVVFICLVVANMLLMGVGILTTSAARMAIEFGLFLLAFLLLVLSKHYKDYLVAQRQLEEQQLHAQAQLSRKRLNFIDETGALLDQQYGELELAAGRIKATPQSRLYTNGLTMIASLRNAMATIRKATDMETEAPLFAVTAYINKLVKDLQPSATEHNVRLVVNTGQGIVARIQPEELRQLVSSITDNALKFSEAGGTVEITTRKSFGKVVITVRDHGVGISQQKLGELFSPFSRATDTLRYDYEGRGLSLYIDKVILVRLGGKIDMTSERGKGTKVTITLPSAGQQNFVTVPELIVPEASQNGGVVASAL